MTDFRAGGGGGSGVSVPSPWSPGLMITLPEEAEGQMGWTCEGFFGAEVGEYVRRLQLAFSLPLGLA